MSIEVVQRWRDDWTIYMRQVLGVHRMAQMQTDAVAQIQRNAKENSGTGKTLIKSGHGTGKTWLCAALAHCFHELYRDSAVLLMSSSGTQVRERLWSEYKRMHRKARVPIGGQDLLSMSHKFNEKWKVLAVSPSDPNNFQGEHADRILIIFDEAQAVGAEFWEAAEGMLNSENAMFVGIFNPLYLHGAAYEAWQRPDEFQLITFNCLEHENVVTGRNVIPGAVTRAWVDLRRERWGEDSILFQTRVLGNFPKSSVDTVLSPEEFTTVKDYTPDRMAVYDGAWMGLDVARYGADRCRWYVAKDRRVIAGGGWEHKSTMETVGLATQVAMEYDVPWDQINVDVGGMGAGVVDRFREMERHVNAVDFGSRPVGDFDLDVEVVNRRAELYWGLRTLIRHRKASVPERFSSAWTDVVAHRYKFRSDGAVQIESKEDIRKRLRRSPDDGDALVLAFAREKNSAPVVVFV